MSSVVSSSVANTHVFRESCASSWSAQLRFVASAVCAAAALAACGGGAGDAPTASRTPPSPPPVVNVASVSLDRSAATLVQGESVQFIATARDVAGNALVGRDIVWTSSAPAVATASGGYVTAIAVGVATVTASSEGRSAAATVTIAPEPVASISLPVDRLSLLVGARDTAQAVVRAADGSVLTGRTVTWSSGNTGVASVADGVITAVAPGTATVSAISEGIRATMTVEVRALSCASTVPTGRLSRPQAGGAFVYTTTAGWTITIDQNALLIRAIDSNGAYDFWGSTHETLRGKHIKDILGTRRSLLLAGNAMVTFDITARAVLTPPQAWVNFIAIYDGNQTHRIDLQTFQVTQSCAIARFGEADEHDGETAELREEVDGFYFNNLYTQDASATGVPLSKVFQTVRLGFADYVNRFVVLDYFDDPRLGHT